MPRPPTNDAPPTHPVDRFAPVDTDVHCPECDYNLTGAGGNRCPWCGAMIDSAAHHVRPTRRTRGAETAAACGCAVLGIAIIAGLTALLRGSKSLGMKDAFVVVAALVAACGQLILAVLIGRRRPNANHLTEHAHMFYFAACFSIVLGAAGAASVSSDGPQPVVLEFLVAVGLFTLPGWTLLVMSFVSLGMEDRSQAVYVGADCHEAPFCVVAAGPYRTDQVAQEWTDRPRPTDAVIEGMIARTWEAEVALATSQGRLMVDAELIRMASCRTTASGLRLQLATTRYRDFVGTNLHNLTKARSRSLRGLADPLGISGVVVTRDGYLALGRRSRNVMFHAGCLHTFATLLDPKDKRANGEFDLIGAMRRRLMEELTLTPGEVTDATIMGLVRDRSIEQPELLMDVSITVTKQAIMQRFDPSLAFAEYSDIEFLSDKPEAVLPFLLRSAPVAPVAEAALLLHGQRVWGRDWYDRTCLLRYGHPPSAC